MHAAIATLQNALSTLRKAGPSDPEETAKIAQEIRDHEDALNILRSQARPRGEDAFGNSPSAVATAPDPE